MPFPSTVLGNQTPQEFAQQMARNPRRALAGTGFPFGRRLLLRCSVSWLYRAAVAEAAPACRHPTSARPAPEIAVVEIETIYIDVVTDGWASPEEAKAALR